MFESLFNLFSVIIEDLSMFTVALIDNVSQNGTTLDSLNINLLLFSETPILSTNLYDLLILFFGIFYTMFFIVFLYKGTKKFITMVFGVFKL